MLLKTIAIPVSALMVLAAVPAGAETAGVTETEIKTGATFPFSGPASSSYLHSATILARLLTRSNETELEVRFGRAYRVVK